MLRALLAEAFGYFGAVHTVDPMEIFGHGAGFVRLQRSDKVPVDIQISKLRYFFQRFLQVVFAETALIVLVSGAYVLCRTGFADSEQQHAIGWPAA